MKILLSISTLVLIVASFSFNTINPVKEVQRVDSLHYANEHHFKNVQQLTFGGDNAEAYWSYDSKNLIFQRTNPAEGLNCDQIFAGKIPQSLNEKFHYKLLSTGKGRTTCSYFMKDGKHVIYASTHLGADTCPPLPDRAKYGNKYIVSFIYFCRVFSLLLFPWWQEL